MIARPKINERNAAESGAFEVGRVARVSRPGQDGAGRGRAGAEVAADERERVGQARHEAAPRQGLEVDRVVLADLGVRRPARAGPDVLRRQPGHGAVRAGVVEGRGGGQRRRAPAPARDVLHVAPVERVVGVERDERELLRGGEAGAQAREGRGEERRDVPPRRVRRVDAPRRVDEPRVRRERRLEPAPRPRGERRVRRHEPDEAPVRLRRHARHRHGEHPLEARADERAEAALALHEARLDDDDAPARRLAALAAEPARGVERRRRDGQQEEAQPSR